MDDYHFNYITKIEKKEKKKKKWTPMFQHIAVYILVRVRFSILLELMFSSADYLNLRSISSLNNFQNSEMK
jgi:hypothetical protein